MTAAPQARPAAPGALYNRFARFVPDDLAHMDQEQAARLADLQSAFSDAELQELEGRTLPSIPPAHMVLFVEAMLDSMPQREGATMIAATKAAMPPEALDGLVAGIDARRATRVPLRQAA